jgi:hypothetical protein
MLQGIDGSKLRGPTTDDDKRDGDVSHVHISHMHRVVQKVTRELNGLTHAFAGSVQLSLGLATEQSDVLVTQLSIQTTVGHGFGGGKL